MYLSASRLPLNNGVQLEENANNNVINQEVTTVLTDKCTVWVKTSLSFPQKKHHKNNDPVYKTYLELELLRYLTTASKGANFLSDHFANKIISHDLTATRTTPQ